MKIKNFLIFSMFILFSLLMSYKVSAASIGYCQYGNVKKQLPFKIGANLNGVISNNMFSNDKINESNQKYIYDKSSCISGIDFNYSYNSYGHKVVYRNGKEYLIDISYFYIINGSEYPTNNTLNGGIYSIKDETPPVIEAKENPLILSSEDNLTLEDLKSYINYYDNSDPKIKLELVYENYSSNHNKPGSYNLNYKACDKDNNCTNFTHKVIVKDFLSPIISGIDTYESYMSNPLTIDEVISKLKVSDNIDSNLEDNIYLDKSTYNLSVPGVYYLYFKVKDSSNNVSNSFKVKINYYDDIIPTITGPNNFTSNMSNPLKVEDILYLLKYKDNLNNDISKNVFIVNDNFTINKYNLGTFNVAIKVLDTSNNESLPFLINIEVKDDIKPTIKGDVSYNSLMSNPISLISIINKLIVYDNYDGNINSKVEIIQDEFTNNYNSLSSKLVLLKVKDSSNNYSDIFKLEITNIDDIKPTIKGVNLYNTTDQEKLNIDTISYSLICNDNVDKQIDLKLELDKENYSSNFNTPGVYYLSYYTCDNSGNISLPFKVKIVVNKKTDYIESINDSIIYLNIDKLVSSNEILEILKVDTKGFKSINIIENTYSNNFNVKGEYKIIYQLINTDESNRLLRVKIKTYKKEIENKTDNMPVQIKKKETVFSSLISFFNNIFNYFLNLFK